MCVTKQSSKRVWKRTSALPVRIKVELPIATKPGFIRFIVPFNLYNDVNATRAVIGRCPWSIRGQIHGWRHGKLSFCFVQHGGGLKIFVWLFLIKASEGLKKRLAGAIYKEEKWRNGEKKRSWLKKKTLILRGWHQLLWGILPSGPLKTKLIIINYNNHNKKPIYK